MSCRQQPRDSLNYEIENVEQDFTYLYCQIRLIIDKITKIVKYPCDAFECTKEGTVNANEHGS